MKRVVFLLVLLLLPARAIAAAETCPAPAQPPATTEAAIKRGHEERFAAKIDGIEDQLRSQSFPAIALGDSIMQRWPHDMLSEAMGMATVDAGVGGDTTESTLWRLDHMDWSRQSPRFVLILIGTNDGGHFGGCDVYWGIRAVVSKAHQIFPKASLIVTSILPRGDNMLQRDADISTTNKALRGAAATAGFDFFDVHDAFLCNHQTACDLVVPPTNVHPTRKGYELMGGRLHKFVASLPQ